MTLHKGDRVKVVKNPYGAMFGTRMVGLTAVVSKAVPGGSTRAVSLKFDKGLRVQFWLMLDDKNRNTLELV